MSDVKRLWRPRLATTLSVMCLSIGVLGLGACSSTSTFDQKSLEKGVNDGLAKQVGEKLAAVACPANVSTKKGTTFRCTLTAPDGSTIGATGTVNDDKGHFDILVDQNVATPPTGATTTVATPPST
jgi:hypothetical protein